MRTRADEIVRGLENILSLFPKARDVVLIENNKPEAIKAMTAACSSNPMLSVLGSFVAFMGIFGGHGFDPAFLLAHISAGGSIVMGALFMTTAPVTSPVSNLGQVVYGAAVGILSGLFRVLGNAADSVGYAIIFSNMLSPIIDQFIVTRPCAYRGYKVSTARTH